VRAGLISGGGDGKGTADMEYSCEGKGGNTLGMEYIVEYIWDGIGAGR